MRVFNNILYVALGFVIAAFTISLTSVGAQVSEGLSRVFIANDFKNPIPVVSKETLKIRGEVKIDGKPEVKLDGDTKIKIESIDDPVKIRFDKNAAMPETEIFREGKRYNITLAAAGTAKTCALDKINGIWIYCERKGSEGEITGWINTAQISLVENL